MSTPREQLSAALKKARLAAGFDSQGKLATAMSLTRTVVVKAESPHGPVPSGAVLVAWSKVTGTDLAELVELAQRVRSGVPEWFVNYLSAEQVATRLRFWAPGTVLPGIVQTEAYAMAVEKSDAVVAQRVERQKQVLGRAQVTVALDSRVLSYGVGSPAIMMEQCGHLVTLAETGLISLHVVPAWTCVGVNGGFAVAWSKTGHATVNLGTTTRDITSTAPDLIGEVLGAYDAILGAALPVVQSVEFVRTQEETWKEQV